MEVWHYNNNYIYRNIQKYNGILQSNQKNEEAQYILIHRHTHKKQGAKMCILCIHIRKMKRDISVFPAF